MNDNFINNEFLIIAFSNDLYKFHYSLSMATSLKAIGRKVSVFISGYSCNFIRKDWSKFDMNQVNKKLVEKKMASLEEMFKYCRDLDVDLYFCETALSFLNIKSSNLISNINAIGMYKILSDHKDSQLIFI